jgi:hypothetical protein
MSMIDIGTVLNKFDDTYDEFDFAVKDYGIQFITSDGRLRSMRARKNVKEPKRQLKAGNDPKGKFRYNLNRTGTMLVHDLAIDEPRSIKPAMLCAFADHQQTEFHRIRH